MFGMLKMRKQINRDENNNRNYLDEKRTKNKTNDSHQTFTGCYTKLTAYCASLATKKRTLKEVQYTIISFTWI